MNRNRMRFQLALLAGAALGLAGIASCTPKFTAHDSRVPAHQTNLNRKSLSRIFEAEKKRTTELGKGATAAEVTGARTASAVNTELKVGLIADSHSDYVDFEKVVSLVNGHQDLDLVLLLGDFTNVGMIWEYQQAWNIMKHISAPLVVVEGNHDAVGFGKEIFRDMFGATDFSFTVKGVRFVVWANSKLEYERKTHRFDELEKALSEKSDAKKTILVSHIPPTEPEVQIYTTAERNQFHNIIKSHGASVSIHGHRHARGRQNVGGIDYVTVERVRGVNYSIMTVKEGVARFEHCNESGCVPTPEPETSVPQWN